MEKNIMRTLDDGERVTSAYAEIYHNDDYCDFKSPIQEVDETVKKQPLSKNEKDDERDQTIDDEWVSPSDLLIGILDLKPPFTSKITRGQTHQGILKIGDDILQAEHEKFLNYLAGLIQDNESAWSHIQEQEKKEVAKKVKAIYANIFQTKCESMEYEISKFYEETLQELEDHMRREAQTVLTSAHTSMINDLNFEIVKKLKKEKEILENILLKRYKDEVEKITKYYKLLLENELHRHEHLINHALYQRNDALNAFYRQVEAQNTTGTMYVMCTERKKCRIKKFLLENYQTADIAEKQQKIKEKQDTLDEYKRKKVPIYYINRDWEEKINKILRLFLKFISYSLKLLPEQTTFLLDLEQLVVLQLNEIQKHPYDAPSLLKEDTDVYNIFKFAETSPPESVCDKEPFVIEGDLADSIPTSYGSRDTIPSDVDLPYVRLNRKFIYAKCQRMEDVKELLEKQRCKCSDIPGQQPSHISLESEIPITEPLQSLSPTVSEESSNELMIIDDIQRLRECPFRACTDWVNKSTFPNLTSYLDFTEENYARVTAILSEKPPHVYPPELINPKDIVFMQLPFSATGQKYYNAETQYSSQEEFDVPDVECPCMNTNSEKIHKTPVKEVSSQIPVTQLLMKRKISLFRLIHSNPNLLKMFTDECFDFIL